jgi:hypothetical protein
LGAAVLLKKRPAEKIPAGRPIGGNHAEAVSSTSRIPFSLRRSTGSATTLPIAGRSQGIEDWPCSVQHATAETAIPKKHLDFFISAIGFQDNALQRPAPLVSMNRANFA